MQMIVVNGKSYSSIDDMPPEIRKIYQEIAGILADNNKNGIPDILESNSETNIQNISINSGGATIINTDGKIFTNVSELPQEAQDKYRFAMAKLGQVFSDKNQNGIPDAVENVQPMLIDTDIKIIDGKIIPITSSPKIITSVIEYDESRSRRWIILGLLLVILIGLALAGSILLIPLLNGNYARLHL